MCRKIVQMRDKYKSTTREYPKVLEQCLPTDYQGLPAKLDDKVDKELAYGTEDTFTLKIDLNEDNDAIILSANETAEDNLFNSTGYISLTPRQMEISYVDSSSGLPDPVTVGHISLGNGGGIELEGEVIDLHSTNGDIDINTGDGKLYINGVEYTGGGGSQLYQHNIYIEGSFGGDTWKGTLIINSNVSTPYTDLEDIKLLLETKGYYIPNRSVTPYKNVKQCNLWRSTYYNTGGIFVTKNDSDLKVCSSIYFVLYKSSSQ